MFGGRQHGRRPLNNVSAYFYNFWSEIDFERQFFQSTRDNLRPYGEFSCACNVVLLPKGTVRPTDNSPAIKAAFYKRYIDLYGELPLGGRIGFDDALAPDWYDELAWNDPPLPDGWEVNIEKLLKYRTDRITAMLSK